MNADKESKRSKVVQLRSWNAFKLGEISRKVRREFFLNVPQNPFRILWKSQQVPFLSSLAGPLYPSIFSFFFSSLSLVWSRIFAILSLLFLVSPCVVDQPLTQVSSHFASSVNVLAKVERRMNNSRGNFSRTAANRFSTKQVDYLWERGKKGRDGGVSNYELYLEQL